MAQQHDGVMLSRRGRSLFVRRLFNFASAFDYYRQGCSRTRFLDSEINGSAAQNTVEL